MVASMLPTVVVIRAERPQSSARSRTTASATASGETSFPRSMTR